jgi:hypothetical protein
MPHRVSFTAVLLPLLLLLPPRLCPAQEMKLPVFTLRYEGGVGSEEVDPGEGIGEGNNEGELEPSSRRHLASLRIKEQWSGALTTNLYTAVSRKEYLLEAGSYLYFYLNPDVSWKVSDRLTWSAALRSKWVWYDEPDSDGRPKDLTTLLARTELSVRLPGDLKLTPSLQSVLDLYRNEEKVRQLYAAGIGLESRLGEGWRVSGRCRGILSLPLGQPSTVAEKLNYELGLSAAWDPNR